MRKVMLTSCLSFLFFLACKKDNPSSAQTGNGTTAGGSGITSSNATSWYGLLGVGKTCAITSNSLSIAYNVSVNFFKIPRQFPGIYAALVDSVKINAMPLMLLDSTYVDTSGMASGIQQPISYPYTYKVVGIGNIPSFSYIVNGPFPSFSNYSVLPDTIHKSNGFSFSLNGLNNADEVIIKVSEGSKSASKTLIPPYPSIVSFNTVDLITLDTNSHSMIEFILAKLDNKNVYGKPMLFSTGLTFSKNIVIK